ncbi:Putative pentatricopeptide repeat-containing protein [Striga hermonthica]|uniref:Pentatricopeptide repeat-containing protein n=1 Tax=Striga hermonthica TaxID=68872 RepID=A0A9N7N8F6_STRHE|nr:Putative pentatricopeptide repeat-containing protein [Striga hermonthica]
MRSCSELSTLEIVEILKSMQGEPNSASTVVGGDCEKAEGQRASHSALAINSLIKRLVGGGRVDTVVAMYKQLKTIGLNPNVYTYAIMIITYYWNNCFEEAGNVLSEMEAAEPDSFMYFAYLEGLCMNGLIDSGNKVLQSCKAGNVLIDAYAYTTVIQDFFKEKKLREAENVLLDMEEYEMIPSEADYRALVPGMCGRTTNNYQWRDFVRSEDIMTDNCLWFDRTSLTDFVVTVLTDNQVERKLRHRYML